MAELTEFNIGQGETFRVLLTITDTDTGAPLNLSDYSLTGKVRENYSAARATTSLSLESAIPLNSGSVFVGLSASQTLALTQRKYVYDINLVKTADSTVRRILEGYIVVRPTATR